MKQLVLLFCLFQSTAAFPCTIFKSPFIGDTRISHNVDWNAKVTDVRGVLVMNPAHMKKVGELMGAPVLKAEWVSKWRSISFSIMGAEFPVGGFNEKGLSMAVLELPESQFPPIEDPRPALGMAQFVQYNLDTAESIDDIVASDKILRPFSTFFKMHFFACDANDECAVIQYIDGQMTVYRGEDLPFKIMTNSLYTDSVATAKSCTPDSCTAADTSLWRFAEVSRLQTQMKQEQNYEAQTFNILDTVAQAAGSQTRFQLTYDAKNLLFSLRKKGTTDLSYLNVDFANVQCQDPRRVIAITENIPADLHDSWQILTEEFQTELAAKIGLPPAAAALYGKYPFEKVSCE